MQSISSFYLCIDLGDIVYSLLISKLLSVKKLVVDGGCGVVKFNWESANFIKPLLESQSYIDSVESYNGQIFDYNYGLHPANMPVVTHTDLTKFHASKFDLLDHPELNNPWLESEINNDSFLKDKKIIINRTNRYHGDYTFYSNFLKYINPKYLLFLGIEEEHRLFQDTFNIKIDYLKTPDVLTLTKTINSVPCFLGNESLICAIATGLGKNCYIEYGRYAANYIFSRQNIIYF